MKLGSGSFNGPETMSYKRWWVRLHEKGGKQHEMPCHHLLETYVDAYVTAADIGTDKAGALFRTLGVVGASSSV